jgi:ComF family protein
MREDRAMLESEIASASAGARERAPGAVRAVLASCLDLIVPPCCLVCRTPLSAHHALCAQCWRQVNFIRPPLCDVLGIPLPYDAGERMVSSAAVARPPPYDRARAVAHFSGAVRTLVHQLKYADRHDARALLGRWLVEAGRDLLPGADLIVPVPLARLRLLLRGFNQSALLARELARLTGIEMDPLLLRRKRSTRTQVGLSWDQRRRNVAGAFAVPKRRATAVRGRNVLLVDDVITSGATVEACARALKRAGAARVDVLALALVTDEARAAL